jgi:hypothetical protein
MTPTIRFLGVALPFALLSCSAEGPEIASVSQKASVIPTFVEGNPTCADLGLGTHSVKFDPPLSGTRSLGGEEWVSMGANGIEVDWQSSIGIDAVIVKGGPNANVYVYPSESTGDTGLTAPVNPNTEQPFGLSHVDFCFDWELKVEKSALPELTRTFAWSILKTGADSALTLSAGQIFSEPYQVVVDVTGSTDSGWAVSGSITVKNPAPMAATVTAVTDLLDGAPLAVSCPVELPHVLAAGAELVCSYAAALPNASSLMNVAEASTTGAVGPGSGSALVDFAEATIHGVDACIAVTDDRYGSLGTACATEAPKSFGYSMNIGPYESCGEHEFVNVASFTAADSGANDSSSFSVAIEVPCIIGCTLTPGYWKTHSENGPAPYDETWALLPSGASSPFFLSGQSYFQVLRTPPAGNAYYILAHAYIAAELNGLNGAATGDVDAALAAAKSLFESSTPADLAGAKGRSRSFITMLATALDSFNNGLTGPGHCSE